MGKIIVESLEEVNDYINCYVNYNSVLQFISADTNELLCSCTGEGQGETDADDIRQAINSVVEFVS